jgi:hypothetical protein
MIDHVTSLGAVHTSDPFRATTSRDALGGVILGGHLEVAGGSHPSLPKFVPGRALSRNRSRPPLESERAVVFMPTSSVCSGAPEPASQSLTVLSFEPDATSLPFGENATDY